MRKRSNSPIFWALFGAGGMLSALFGGALVVITGIATPTGLLLSPQWMSYARMLSLTQHWLAKAFVFAVITLFAWHAAHRLLCTVHDFGIHKTPLVKSIGYGFAMAVTLAAAYGLLAIGF